MRKYLVRYNFQNYIFIFELFSFFLLFKESDETFKLLTEEKKRLVLYN